MLFVTVSEILPVHTRQRRMGGNICLRRRALRDRLHKDRANQATRNGDKRIHVSHE